MRPLKSSSAGKYSVELWREAPQQCPQGNTAAYNNKGQANKANNIVTITVLQQRKRGVNGQGDGGSMCCVDNK